MGAILVTGASRGIGRGIALELASAGHRVAIHYNGNREAAESTAAECATRYAQAHAGPLGDGPAGAASAAPPSTATGRAAASGEVAATSEAAPSATTGRAAASGEAAAVFQANIAVPADRERLVAEVTERFGSIAGLVNNAGIAPRKRDDIVYAEEEIFDEVMRVNLYGPYFLTQLVARGWIAEREAGEGEWSSLAQGEIARRIVFVTSISAETVSTNRGEYCVSKAGLGMASQLFAARLAGDGILVFEVRPGITATDMTSGVKDKYDGLIGEGLVPQRRWGYPKDTGVAVGSIMAGNLDFAPGSVIYTDGGLHIPRL